MHRLLRPIGSVSGHFSFQNWLLPYWTTSCGCLAAAATNWGNDVFSQVGPLLSPDIFIYAFSILITSVTYASDVILLTIQEGNFYSCHFVCLFLTPACWLCVRTEWKMSVLLWQTKMCVKLFLSDDTVGSCRRPGWALKPRLPSNSHAPWSICLKGFSLDQAAMVHDQNEYFSVLAMLSGNSFIPTLMS